MRIALVVPHMFMNDEVISDVIFAPGSLAVDLASGLKSLGHEVTFFSPGFSHDEVENIHPDLTLFKDELGQRGYGYTELLKKHPLLFITLARQAQSELIAKVIQMANQGNFDLIHFYTNEEELALVISQFCNVPTVFTHHEPFNYLAKYRNAFPRHKEKNWVSISYSQQKSMPLGTNFVANIYNGIDKARFRLNLTPDDYLVYFGRIIEPKGVDIAINAAKIAGMRLKIAGKHYAGYGNDNYWEEIISPQIDGEQIEYLGFINSDEKKQDILGKAKALLMPSTWEEPFGMVMIESLACGTPIIGLDSGSIPEIVEEGKTGFIAKKIEKRLKLEGNKLKSELDREKTAQNLVKRISLINQINRSACRKDFEERFTLKRMCREHEEVYKKILN